MKEFTCVLELWWKYACEESSQFTRRALHKDFGHHYKHALIAPKIKYYKTHYIHVWATFLINSIFSKYNRKLCKD